MALEIQVKVLLVVVLFLAQSLVQAVVAVVLQALHLIRLEPTEVLVVVGLILIAHPHFLQLQAALATHHL